jgi:hypothetical protein
MPPTQWVTVTKCGTVREALTHAAGSYLETKWMMMLETPPYESVDFKWYSHEGSQGYAMTYVTVGGGYEEVHMFTAPETVVGGHLSLREWTGNLHGMALGMWFGMDPSLDPATYLLSVMGDIWDVVDVRIALDITPTVLLDEVVTSPEVADTVRGAHVRIWADGYQLYAFVDAIEVYKQTPTTGGRGSLSAPSVLVGDLVPICVGGDTPWSRAHAKATQDLAAQNIDLSFDNGRFIYSIRSKEVTE